MRDFRCIFCNRLLFRWLNGSFKIEVKCPQSDCRAVNVISWEEKKQEEKYEITKPN